MKSHERAVKHFDCVLRASVRRKNTAAAVRPAKLRDMLQAFQRRLVAGDVIEIKSVGDIQVWRLVEIMFDARKKRAVMLINRSDRNAADQAIANTETGNLRVAKKLANEGNAYSAHIAFRLDEIDTDKYEMLVEDVSGISSRRITRVLAAAIRSAREAGESIFNYPHPDGGVNKDGSARTLQANYHFEVMGHPALDFVQELNNGVLHGIEVINTKKTQKKWDSFNATEYIGNVVRLRPVKNPSQSHLQIVGSVCSSAKLSGMTEVRVRFTDTEQVTHTVALDPNDGSLANEDRFIKKSFIRNFNDRLDTGFESIQPEIRDKMFHLIR